ncbi:glycosyltransferase family 4 protein [Vibrio proteolyticus]|uniref:Putative glycosyltransferase n=1 Tax=Vibrio proteolyticus NBRC 13287 TaxID=1219065 RepID=U2ZZT6_VIBPR|nr:glycosyltransferase family 4 protein [Vibrio proteolyticus]GAD66612.1 putative glycosyltransferase [Vibrio proteolyticus NBRC 13287]
MNICHVNLASGYHGGENQTLQLIKQQIEMGYQLTVVANPKSPFADAIRQLDCQLVLAKNYFQAHARSVTDGCSLIHVHEGRAIYWALLQNVLHGVPYIVTRRIDNKMKKKWLANMAYRRATAVVGLSREIVRRISEAYPVLTTYQIPSSPVSYPVDETEAASIRQRFENKHLVIHAANMLTHKGFDVTIEAARRLEQSHPEIHFALLGDGKERATLETLATGLSNLSFVGKQSNMGSWFRAADLQVHPSYTEGLGSVILEGLHSGLPVIATNAGGIPDIIEDGVSGRLIEPGDAAALAEAIVQLSQNEALRQRLLAGAQHKLKDFYIEHTALLYQDIYQKVDASYGQ